MVPAASPDRSSSGELLEPEFLQARTPGSSSRQRRWHLDVGGGRKRESQVGEGEEEEVPARKSLLGGNL